MRIAKKIPHFPVFTLTASYRIHGGRQVTKAVVCVALLAGTCMAGTDPPTPKQGLQLTGSDNSDTSRSPTFQQRYPRYQLRPGDTFSLEFAFTPEFNQTITVLPDGFINLRGVGDLHIAGKTVPELTAAILGAYDKILNKPSIIVSLKDFEKPYFIASGQVQHPGKYELRADTTLVEGIAIAGGLTDSAKHSQVLLFRKVSSDWMEGRILDVKKMLNQKNLSEDLHLKPGDMIIVPQSKVSKIRRYIPATGLGIGINY
jgi:protein involved in polysaccharide export with SLBB domain